MARSLGLGGGSLGRRIRRMGRVHHSEGVTIGKHLKALQKCIESREISEVANSIYFNYISCVNEMSFLRTLLFVLSLVERS